ncbi:MULTISPECIES: conjugal transfer protein TraH [unclassified Thiomonas]|uniref:conjugal transfer protein TraH n=2 Tax=unclassified Thiomonas TaxID=2625466 RepID=UPI0004DBC1DE|nr:MULTISPECIES: conjugal transfer protein TraH [unclassified Thiomonas]VDY05813.1 putative TraH family protein [Thiomonas sp. Bio17B3]VDY10888.1 putative TraH family protein [Thiomonas sp. Sup16B3]CDW92494.1 putative Pilus assembly protein TraH [Thiomonas sp. CB2]VDY14072.1 putative Pilus assembly protein TraH [Thiomonas sp. OC7]VDY16734.1 putative Pilus assembly protein TraH [Thiomonas sp. CB2]
MNNIAENKRRKAQGRVSLSPLLGGLVFSPADRLGLDWIDLKSIAAMLAATMLISASALPPAQADLNSVLSGMYTAAGSPGVYQTQNSGVISGGYVAVRTPIQDVNLVSFSPPNIGAGCGGIDLFMGSFSFVNAQAFENLLRQIGQQALGYAFQLAINSMCHSCGALLSSIQSAMQKMNSSLKNTCQLAHGLTMRAKTDGLASISKDVGDVMASAVGVQQDIFGAFNSRQSSPGSNESALASKSATVPGANGQQQTLNALDLSPYGNQTWKALENSQSDQLIDQDNVTKEILMSMVGSEIVRPGMSTADQAGASAMGATQGDTPINVPATLSLKDMVDGTPNAQVNVCQAWASSSSVSYPAFPSNPSDTSALTCLQTSTQTLSSLNYQGIKGWVRNLMWGESGGDPGIVNQIIAGQPLTAAEQQLINMSGIGFMPLMIQVQQYPGAVRSIASQVEPYVVAELAVGYGQALYQSVASSFAGNPHAAKPQGFDSNMQNLQNWIRAYTQELDGLSFTMNQLTTFVNNVHKSMSRRGS